MLFCFDRTAVAAQFANETGNSSQLEVVPDFQKLSILPSLDTFFRQIKSFLRFRLAFVFGKGAHPERNQPVPVPGFKTFCYRALNICSKIRAG